MTLCIYITIGVPFCAVGTKPIKTEMGVQGSFEQIKAIGVCVSNCAMLILNNSLECGTHANLLSDFQ